MSQEIQAESDAGRTRTVVKTKKNFKYYMTPDQKPPLTCLIDQIGNLLALFWRPTVFFTFFYLFIALIGGIGIAIKSNMNNSTPATNITKNNSTNHTKLFDMLDSTMNQKVTTTFKLDNLIKFEIINHEESNIGISDSLRNSLKSILLNQLDHDGLEDISFSGLIRGNYLILNANLTINYFIGESAIEDSSRSKMINLFIKKLNKIDLNNLHGHNLKAPILTLDDLKIKNNYCTETKAIINESSSIVINESKTCHECSFDSKGIQFKYCNITITLINSPTDF